MKYIICLLPILFLSGCRAVEKTTEQEQAITGILDISDSGYQDIRNLFIQDKYSNSVFSENEMMDILITGFTPPDSSGKQHKSGTARIKYNRDRESREQEDEHQKEATVTKAEMSGQVSQFETVEQREREHKEKPPERWPYMVLAIVMLPIGYGIYKKTIGRP